MFYLDAHWDVDLPLAEEIDLVFSNWSEAVVLIDDFQVADDTGYGFDDYGFGKALTMAYISTMQDKFELKVFFPTSPSSQETGARRGCVVLVANPILDAAIGNLGGLRPYDPTVV